ncbi:hypothetical protein JB92DRAFT_3107891 [Gautieria morchelliformis]|nr:hypothetical protein JB92DRAFT_3107891 [Gautieria morchelliformis]
MGHETPHPAAPSTSGGNPFPPFQQQSPTTEERSSEAATPQQRILQGPPQKPLPSQLSQPPPPPLPTGLPPATTSLPQGSSFMPPISLNPASGMSIDHSLPDVESALGLAITKHEFHPSVKIGF